MLVLRRLDAVLEPTKAAVLSMKDNLDGDFKKSGALRMMMARLTLWLLTLNWFGPLAWLPHVRL